MTNTLIGKQCYLFDADVLIVAKNNYYNPEIVPAFWQWILEGHQQGYFYSIDKVSNEDELKRGNEEDFLHQFAIEYSGIFLPSNNMDCIAEYAKLQTWVRIPVKTAINSNSKPPPN